MPVLAKPRMAAGEAGHRTVTIRIGRFVFVCVALNTIASVRAVEKMNQRRDHHKTRREALRSASERGALGLFSGLWET
jgi:hypothetical protein